MKGLELFSFAQGGPKSAGSRIIIAKEMSRTLWILPGGLWKEVFSPVVSSLTHWLFQNVMFTLHTFVNSSVFLLLLISNFIPPWSEDTFYNPYLFKSVEA